jgi:hypothetical protein
MFIKDFSKCPQYYVMLEIKDNTLVSHLLSLVQMKDDYSLLNCIYMMFLDAIIYGLLTWYIEAVFPGR